MVRDVTAVYSLLEGCSTADGGEERRGGSVADYQCDRADGISEWERVQGSMASGLDLLIFCEEPGSAQGPGCILIIIFAISVPSTYDY